MLSLIWAETGDDVKNVEVNFGMLKTLIEVRAALMLEHRRARKSVACFT